RALPQHQHQRGPPEGPGGVARLPRHVLHGEVHTPVRRAVDRRREPEAVRRGAARVLRRRRRPHGAPAHVLGPAGTAQAVPRRRRARLRRPLMLKGIDHLVVAVPDLDVARKSYEALGFTVVPGGRHPIGTHNALIAFADGAYLELIAFFEPNAQHRWYQRLQQGGGFIDYCLQTDDLAGDVRAFRAAGVPVADPRPLSRV